MVDWGMNVKTWELNYIFNRLSMGANWIQ